MPPYAKNLFCGMLLIVTLLVGCGEPASGPSDTCPVQTATLPPKSLWTLTEYVQQVSACKSKKGANCKEQLQLHNYCTCFYGALSQRVAFTTYSKDTENYEDQLDRDGTNEACENAAGELVSP